MQIMIPLHLLLLAVANHLLLLGGTDILLLPSDTGLVIIARLLIQADSEILQTVILVLSPLIIQPLVLH